MEAANRSGIVIALFAGLLAACAGPTAPAIAQSPPAAAPPPAADVRPPVAAVSTPEAASSEASSAPEPERPQPVIACGGPAKQGGAVLCQTLPGGVVTLDGAPIAIADVGGSVVIGLPRDQPSPAKIAIRPPVIAETPPTAVETSTEVEVLPRKDTVSRFEMECARIAPQSPADQRHAEVSWVRKDKAMKAFHPPMAPVALVKPADGPYSSAFGVTRTYVPKTKDCEGRTSVHNGQDIAIPTGTEIRAPMAGTVLLADPDLFYEGGAVFLDLGRGLVSITMHMSRVDVKDGETVAQGQMLGLSGATGRVTGPHLHWAIKFRNVLSDDRGTDIWLDPLLVLDLKAPD
jgi:murein DD-endopeptidase MepM/ murein hydrolase activator NlpD